MSQRVEFQTSDNTKIVADYYPADSRKGLVLVHMMPATKESWRGFARSLQAEGFHALAIDLRGHGESGGGDYQQFSDEQHQASIADLEAATAFLKQKGVTELSLAGASIGANLSLQHLAEYPETKSAVLLSPGLDYRGIKTAPLASKVADKNKILFVGSKDDEQTMDASCEEIISKLGLTKSIVYDSGGHGTNLFNTHPELTHKLVEFLSSKF